MRKYRDYSHLHTLIKVAMPMIKAALDSGEVINFSAFVRKLGEAGCIPGLDLGDPMEVQYFGDRARKQVLRNLGQQNMCRYNGRDEVPGFTIAQRESATEVAICIADAILDSNKSLKEPAKNVSISLADHVNRLVEELVDKIAVAVEEYVGVSIRERNTYAGEKDEAMQLIAELRRENDELKSENADLIGKSNLQSAEIVDLKNLVEGRRTRFSFLEKLKKEVTVYGHKE